MSIDSIGGFGSSIGSISSGYGDFDAGDVGEDSPVEQSQTTVQPLPDGFDPTPVGLNSFNAFTGVDEGADVSGLQGPTLPASQFQWGAPSSLDFGDGMGATPVQYADASGTPGLQQTMTDASPSGAVTNPPAAPHDPAIDVDAAARTLDRNAGSDSQGLCATYVRRALAAGGMDVSNNPRYARDFGPFLERNGFTAVSSDNYTPQRGDVVVLQPTDSSNQAGHVAMYDGRQWVSDFRQRDFWGGPSYRNQAQYQFYRP